MKLLIDIPEHIYEHAKESSEDSRDEFDAMRAIANGTQQESSSEKPNTCGDAVSRAIVQEEITKSIELNENPYQLWYRIRALPSVTPQQKMGRWHKVSMDKYVQHATYYYECSECGDQHIGQANYCPNCGAKMEVDNG